MLAPQGTNAVLRLAIALDDVFDFKPLDFIGKLFKEDATGTNVLGDVEDESGHLTFNISSLEINEKETRMQIDLRIPVTVDRDKLLKKLDENVAAYDLKYAPFDYVAPLYVPKDSKLIQTLMAVYKEQTGDTKATPQISGGATFARTMHNCVAFGECCQPRRTTCTRPTSSGRCRTCSRRWRSTLRRSRSSVLMINN